MKSVFITGGTTGIGSDLAKKYLSLGWKVGVCGRSPDKFDQTFPNIPENLHFFEVDVSNRDELRKAVIEFSKPIGLDLMIANAGIGFKYKTKIPDFEYSYKMVHINLLGLMYSFEAALEIMIPQGRGHLVGISSLASYNGLPGVSAYSATKSAVTKYCESLNIDLKSFNIDVTCICPGFIDTPLTRGNKHPMPFLLDSPTAVKKIHRAIEKKKIIYSFPFILFLIVKFMSIIPRGCYRRLMKLKLINYSKEVQS